MVIEVAAQSIFAARGPAAAILARLGMALTVIAVAVTLLVLGLIVVALRRRPSAGEPGVEPLAAFDRSASGGRRWIVTGTALTIMILSFASAYTVKVLIGDHAELAAARMTIRITGYQYWWKVEYLDAAGHVTITEANEMHLPAATRVRLELLSADVIHSFWVPGLAGKTDLIPGHRTEMWIEADRPGDYRGQCAEYCGISHANMRLDVMTEDSAGFAAWRAGEASVPPPDSTAARIIAAHGCAACHSLAGQMAARNAPDLTHLGRRTTIAAGMLPNTMANLRSWLLDPQSVKPGTLMPRTGLSPRDATTLATWLETLQ